MRVSTEAAAAVDWIGLDWILLFSCGMCVLVCWNASLYAAALDNEFLDQFQLGISTNPHYLPVVYSCLFPFDCV